MRCPEVLFTSLLTALSFSCGTSSNNNPREPDIYDTCTTDENWRTFDDYETTARVKTDATTSPVWQMPAPGASLPASSPATLAWQPAANVTGSPSGDVTCPAAAASVHRTDFFPPLHLPPVSGMVYDLHFSSGGGDIYRVLTTRQQFTISSQVWTSWAGKTVTVDLVKASLLKNEPEGTLYRATPALGFNVTP